MAVQWPVYLMLVNEYGASAQPESWQAIFASYGPHGTSEDIVGPI